MKLSIKGGFVAYVLLLWTELRSSGVLDATVDH